MKRLLVLLAAALVALCVAPFGASAEDAAPRLDVARPDLSTAPDLRATITLPAELDGTSVPASAFTVSEDGHQRPVTVERLQGDQLEVVLLIDTSGSMSGGPLQAAEDAAIGFVRKAPEGTRIAVVGFGGAPRVASTFSTDRNALVDAIHSLRTRSGTALYDGVVQASGMFQPRADTQRSIVLLGDGDDTNSEASVTTALVRLHQRAVQLDSVGYSTEFADSATLRQLAAGTGGHALTAHDAGALADIYNDFAASLDRRYSVRWRSEASGNTSVRFGLAADGVVAERELQVDVPSQATSSSNPITSSPWTLLVGALCLFGAIFLTGRTTMANRGLRPRLPLAVTRNVASGPSAISRATDRSASLAEGALDRWGKRLSLNHALERAGVMLRPGEFLVLAGAISIGAALAATLLGGPLLGLIVLAAVAFCFRMYLSFRADRRQARFADQLSDTLQLLAGSLRAGYGLLQAIDAVAREADDPTAHEFRRIVIEARLGRDLAEALHSMADRVGGEDFRWIVQAIEIHREVGGDLAQVLDTVATTIRERNQLRRQVVALTAEGRLSANILMVLPVFVLVVVRITNPSYLDELRQGVGPALALGGAVALVGGVIWLRRMCRLVY